MSDHFTDSIAKTRRREGGKAFAYAGKQFASHALALGQAVMAWNYLHERLGGLFCAALDGHSIPSEIWYSSSYDRPRRDMLLGLLRAGFVEKISPHNELASLEIEWIVKEANKLEDVRNDIVHTPILYIDDELAELLQIKAGISTHDWGGHPRAVRLAPKDLLIEFRWFRDRCLVLADYATKFFMFKWPHGNVAWPDRPQLPTREDQKNRQGHSRRRRAK
jgi:hypothetical protein